MATSAGQEIKLQPVSQRATVRVMAERRWRVWRRLAMIVVVSAVIVLLNLLQRDTQSKRGFEKHAEAIAAELQKEFEARKIAPDIFRLTQKKDPVLAAFFFNTGYAFESRRDGSEIGVCCLRAPLGLF